MTTQTARRFEVIDAPVDEAPAADCIITGDYWPLLPEGLYSLCLEHHETAMLFRTPKVYLHFRVIDCGAYQGAKIFAAYRVAQLIGRPHKHGRFKLRPGSDLYRTMCRLSGDEKRPDRISLRSLKNCVVRARVRTVVKDHKQRPLPLSLRYSVIDELLSVEAGIL